MERTLIYTTENLITPLPVSRFLKQKGFSSQNLVQLKKDPSAVLANGIPCFMNHILQPAEGFSEIEFSAMQEIGNIITGAYLNSLSSLTNLTIIPTPPSLTLDMAGAILSVPAIEFGTLGDKILLIQSQFYDEVEIDGYFILVPDIESYPKILSSLGISVA